ncbi:tail fiber domain-containing protein [Lachnoclostridium sp.]|uniref:tail fiber domain-containing protein n=1 Tax=Lachnoclostridium sp. TaxID=2028282 RepID=UPI0028977FBB|nr:tail fiber domain-containing protein [Lachnoclostridium sp.]
MLNISEYLKNIYKNDNLPSTGELAYKELILKFFDGTNTLTVTNNQIVSDSFMLSESLCSTTDLTFGGCEASQLKVTIADVETDLKGMTLTVVQRVNNTYEIPLGVFVIESAKKQADKRFKDVVAYDYCKKLDVDVAAWYNALTWPMTIKSFRLSLFNHLGIGYEDQTLPNDNVSIQKTISPEKLVARDVAKRIGEINGYFGHMSRVGKFKYIGLSALGLYPSETLYPSEDLFPSENNEFLGTAGYKNSEYEEYYVKPIDKLIIRQDDGDVGVSIGSGGNAYIVEDNFICYGMNATQLTNIANAMFLVIKNKYYRPHTTNLIGLPYMEVGDAVSIVTNNDAIETFIFNRTLTGIQALSDEYTATGNETRQVDNSLTSKVTQLKSQTLRIKKDVDGLEIEVNGADGLSTKVKQNANAITAEAKRAIDQEVELAATLSIQAGQISQKVSKGNIIAEINLTPEQVKIIGSKIALEGLVTANNAFKIGLNGVALATTFFVDELKPNNGTKIDATSLNCMELKVQGEQVMSFTGLSNVFSVIGHKHDSDYPSKLHWHRSDTDVMAIRDTPTSTGNYDAIRFVDGDGGNRAATTNFVVSKISGTSDERLKDDIQPLQAMIDKYMKIEPISFKYKDGTTGKMGTCFGVKAQQVKELFPMYKYDVVTKNNSDLNDKERELCPDGMHEVNYNNLHVLTIPVVQDHELRLRIQEETINEQNDKIEKLESMVKELLERGKNE